MQAARKPPTFHVCSFQQFFWGELKVMSSISLSDCCIAMSFAHQGTRPKQQQQGVYPKRAHIFCVCTCHDGPQRAAFHRSCPASQAMSSSRSPRPSPRSRTNAHSARRRGRGGGARGQERRVTATEAPPHQPELFRLFEEEPGGRRPASPAEPPRPQEWIQRRTVEQPAELAPMVQILDARVPQTVDQLVEVLRLLDTVVPEQVIEVPKITLHDVIPQRAVPQMAEQSVDEPLPSFDDFGRRGGGGAAARGPGVVRDGR